MGRCGGARRPSGRRVGRSSLAEHKRRYRAEGPGGACLASGRYNRGLDGLSEGETFPALYLATGPEVCLGEIYRHLTPELLPSPNDFR